MFFCADPSQIIQVWVFGGLGIWWCLYPQRVLAVNYFAYEKKKAHACDEKLQLLRGVRSAHEHLNTGQDSCEYFRFR